MLGGDLEDRVDAEPVELERAVARALVVELVHRQQDRPARRAQLGGDRLVPADETLPAIRHEDQQIRSLDGALPLDDHEFVKRILARAVQTACVEQVEGRLTPRDAPFERIARRAGQGRDDRLPLAGHPVEQRGLPHVGATDQHDRGGLPRHHLASALTA